HGTATPSIYSLPLHDALPICTDRFPELPGTEFERDGQGNYTGVVHGFTFTFIAMETMVPQPGFDEQASALVHAIHDLNRFGVTSDRKSTRLNSSHVKISYAVF